MKTIFSLMLLSFFLMGCSTTVHDGLESDTYLDSKNNLVSLVKEHFSLSNIREARVIFAEKIGDKVLEYVEVTSGDGETETVHITSLPDGDRVVISCFNCPDVCSVNGVIDLENPENSCQECVGCSECKMRSTTTRSILGTLPQTNNIIDLQKVAEESYVRTFGKKAENISITRVENENFDNLISRLIVYVDGDGVESSVALATIISDNVMIGGQSYSKDETVIIDCFGSCDCKERYYPGGNYYECSCSDCKMSIERIEKPAN